MQIRTFDVGQADARLLTSADETILIDVDKTAIEGKLPEEVNQIDRCFVTHLDQDHVRGLNSLVNEGMSIQQVVEPDSSCYEIRNPKTKKPKNRVTKDIAENYDKNIDSLGVESIKQVTTGDSIPLDSDAEIQILGPPPNIDGERPFESPRNEIKDGELKGANENSIAFTLESEDDRTALFMGDVEDSRYCETEKWYVEQHHDSDSEIDLDCDVLFPGHHGSKNATSREFLDAADPEMAVISADPNEYGHPHPDMLRRLHERDVDVYVTDVHGTTDVELAENIPIEHDSEGEMTDPWRVTEEIATEMDDPVPEWVKTAELEEKLDEEQKRNEKLEEENEELKEQLKAERETNGALTAENERSIINGTLNQLSSILGRNDPEEPRTNRSTTSDTGSKDNTSTNTQETSIWEYQSVKDVEVTKGEEGRKAGKEISSTDGESTSNSESNRTDRNSDDENLGDGFSA